MCGINGFSFKDEAKIRRQNQSTSHRGPDDEGFFVYEGISLGQNRLAILDLTSAGHQPMFSEDGNLALVFNGEIYNFPELKDKMQSRGIKFRTRTDTEVILKLFEEKGESCLKELVGIFAFAIWDKRKQELFIARDQFGVKPLFYYHDGKQLIFSSEMKGILTHDIACDIDPDALNSFFRLLYIRGPRTILRNVYKLEPGTCLRFKQGDIDIKRYWDELSFADSQDSATSLEEQIRSKLKAAVKRQMIADVPVGVFLSGGLDSTIVLGLAAEQYSERLKTFSVGFDVPSQFFPRFNEDYLLAKQSAAHYKTEHFDILLKEKDIVDNMEKVVWHMDELVYSPTQVANYLLAKMAGREVKVVLGGDGGDELFGGYTRYYYYDLIGRWQKYMPAWRRNPLTDSLARLSGKASAWERLNATPQELFWSFMAQKEDALAPVLQKDFNKPQTAKDFFFSSARHTRLLETSDMDMAKKMMLMDIETWLVDYSLTRSDKMSMAHGLEQRVPFLDNELFALAMSIPTRFKIKNRHQGKAILKHAMRDYVPDFVAKKKKTGWFVPAAKWLRAGLRDYAFSVLSGEYNSGETDVYIDFVAARKALEDHISGQRYGLNTVWSILSFQIWYNQFIKNRKKHV